jgi:hypothetical protein
MNLLPEIVRKRILRRQPRCSAFIDTNIFLLLRSRILNEDKLNKLLEILDKECRMLN